MKKILTVIMALVICLSAVSCSSAGTNAAETVPAVTPTAVEDVAESPAPADNPEQTAAPEESAAVAVPAPTPEPTTAPTAATAPAQEPAAEAVSQPSASENEVIQINLDNFTQYFELKPAADPYTDEAGSPAEWGFTYGIFLREEYMGRFVSGEVNFELQYDEQYRTFSVNGSSYTLGDTVEAELHDGICKTFGLQDFRSDSSISPLSDYYNAIAGQAYCGSTGNLSGCGEVALVPVNGTVLHAEGSITLSK